MGTALRTLKIFIFLVQSLSPVLIQHQDCHLENLQSRALYQIVNHVLSHIFSVSLNVRLLLKAVLLLDPLKHG